ncbi:hypothetical protein [Cohnella sp.]|uniref:hypothetical protein n=1 Tax=Cohnella sp. TaxID=1883426 RepID=UPI003564EE5D
MVDTMYVGYRTTEIEHRIIVEKIRNLFKGTKHSLHRDKNDKSVQLTYGLAEIGFQEIRLRKNKWGYQQIEIRLRPKLLIDREGYYSLTELHEFSQVAIQFDHILKDLLGLCVPSFFEWRAVRVEFAVDLFVGELSIPRLLYLFRRGNVQDYVLSRKKTIEFWDSATNLYLMSANKTINWYNRYETLLSKQEKKPNKEVKDFSCTKGILRFETQVRNEDKSVAGILSQERYEKEIEYFYKLIVGKGDYYTLEGAIQLIRQKVTNQTKRMVLERLIKLIEQSGGVWRAKKNYKEGSADKFSKRLNQLRELNINPVVLPPEWEIDRLENPYGRIIDYMKKEGPNHLL